MSEPKKKAPKATDAYRGGWYLEPNTSTSPSRTLYDPRYAWRFGQTITAPRRKNGISFFKFPRQIREEIRYYNDPEGYLTHDTLYVEHPEYFNSLLFRPKIEYRTGASSDKNREEYEILRRRFHEAKSVSTPKKQQGGQLGMNEQQLQQAFIQFLAQKTGAKNQQELEAAIQQLGEEGLKQAYAEFMQMMQQQQVQAAKFGAKLNYIKSLRGQCPEGYEISYYKVGGTLCKKCMKKQQEMKDGGQVPKNPIDEFKCGRKMKKKKAQGGAVDFEKCGGKTKKTKKKEEGGELNSTKNPKAFSKMALAKCGAKLKEACKGMKCGSRINKDQKGYPLKETDKKGKTRTVYYKDLATRDSIAANRYNDQEVQAMRPGSYRKNKQGKVQWTPDRTKSPYNKNTNKK